MYMLWCFGIFDISFFIFFCLVIVSGWDISVESPSGEDGLLRSWLIIVMLCCIVYINCSLCSFIILVIGGLMWLICCFRLKVSCNIKLQEMIWLYNMSCLLMLRNSVWCISFYQNGLIICVRLMEINCWQNIGPIWLLGVQNSMIKRIFFFPFYR